MEWYYTVHNAALGETHYPQREGEREILHVLYHRRPLTECWYYVCRDLLQRTHQLGELDHKGTEEMKAFPI